MAGSKQAHDPCKMLLLCHIFYLENLDIKHFLMVEVNLATLSFLGDLNRRKYPQFVADFEFVPVAVETSEIIGSGGCHSPENDRRISWATNDPRHTSNILQQISVAIIRGNALSISSSLRRYAQKYMNVF